MASTIKLLEQAQEIEAFLVKKRKELFDSAKENYPSIKYTNYNGLASGFRYKKLPNPLMQELEPKIAEINELKTKALSYRKKRDEISDSFQRETTPISTLAKNSHTDESSNKSSKLEAPSDAENIRQEYSAVVGYHGALVSSRFTIAGLYVAAIGFLAGAVLAKDATWAARAGGSALACWLTLSLWILELRSRALFSNIAYRGVDIEHNHWKLVEEKWYDGFFSRQYKEPPNYEQDNEALARRLEPDRPRFGWSKKPISITLSKYISHSMGLDLLYAGSGAFWLVLFIISVFKLL